MNIDKNYILLLESNIAKYKNFNVENCMAELEKIKTTKLTKLKKLKICPYCDKKISSYLNYKYHVNNLICKKEVKNKCPTCQKVFSRKNNYQYHISHSVCKNKINNVCELVNVINEEVNVINEEINNDNLVNTIDYQLKIDEQIYKQIAEDEFRNYIKERIAKEYNDKSLEEIKKETPFKKQKISNIFKRQCWNHWVGEHVGKIICPCCKLTEISQLNFSCGHIISESKGGKLIVENVRPICSNCNSSVYIDNLTDYI